MTPGVRGVNSGQRSSSPLTLTLPAGSLAGDWLLAVATGGNSGLTMSGVGTGWTDLVAGTAMGTGNAWVGARQLTAADISTGSVGIASSANQNVSGAIVVFSGCAGFGTPGTVAKRPGSQPTTLATAAGSTGQLITVIQCEKSTANPGISGVAPSAPTVVALFPNGTSMPSVWVGSYTAVSGPADRTITNPVASANALGFQVPVLAAAPTGPTVKLWDGTTEQPVTLAGVWDGAAIQPISLDTYQ